MGTVSAVTTQRRRRMMVNKWEQSEDGKYTRTIVGEWKISILKRSTAFGNYNFEIYKTGGRGRHAHVTGMYSLLSAKRRALKWVREHSPAAQPAERE